MSETKTEDRKTIYIPKYNKFDSLISGFELILYYMHERARIPSNNMAGEKLSPQILEKRAKYRKLLAPLLRTDIKLPAENGFQEARQHIEHGGGLILYAPHIDQIDPLAAYLPLFDMAEAFRNAPLIYPLALHQGKLFGISVPKFTESRGVSTNLIVTESTIRKRTQKLERKISIAENSPFYSSEEAREQAIEKLKDKYPTLKKNDGFEDFAASAETALRNGGVVYSPVQPERASKLETPEEKPLGRLAMLIKRRRIQNVGILVVGMDVDHPNGYMKARGLNLGKRHEVTIGPFFTLEDAVLKAGGDPRNLDEFMVENVVTKLVNPSYLNTELDRRTGEKNYLERKQRK